MPVHVLHIQGMTCNHCVETVTKNLSAVPGVSAAEVNLATQTARVDHAESTGVGALLTAVKNAGFQVTGFQQAVT